MKFLREVALETKNNKEHLVTDLNPAFLILTGSGFFNFSKLCDMTFILLIFSGQSAFWIIFFKF